MEFCFFRARALLIFAMSVASIGKLFTTVNYSAACNISPNGQELARTLKAVSRLMVDGEISTGLLVSRRENPRALPVNKIK